MFVVVSALYFIGTVLMASFMMAVPLEGIGADLSLVTLQLIGFAILAYLWFTKFDREDIKQKVIDQNHLPITQRKTYVPVQFWISLVFIYLANNFTMFIQNTTLYYVITIITFVITLMFIYPLLIESNLGFKKHGVGKIVFYGVIMVVAAMAFNVFYSNLLEVLKVSIPEDSVNEMAVNMMIRQNPVRMFLMVTFNAAIMEEVIFRGLGFRTLLHRNKFAAFALTFVVFSLPHLISGFNAGRGLVEFAFMPIYGMMGVFMAYAYYKTESIYASMLTHLINNSLSFFLTFVALITFI